MSRLGVHLCCTFVSIFFHASIVIAQEKPAVPGKSAPQEKAAAPAKKIAPPEKGAAPEKGKSSPVPEKKAAVNEVPDVKAMPKEDAKPEEKPEKEKPAPKVLEPSVPVSTIAFGEGLREDRSAPVWRALMRNPPMLFIFVGDLTTGNTENTGLRKLKYMELKRKVDIDFMRSYFPVLATWDDADYGVNDAGAEFAGKEDSKKQFLEYLNEPADSPRHQRPGMYEAYTYGPPEKTLQIILLDTRWFRSPLMRKKDLGSASDGFPGPYAPNKDPGSTLLGEEQWKWLEEQLRKPAQIRLIVSSIQVVSEEHGYEKWMNFPHERQKIFSMIEQTGANGVIFLSGDRQQGEISKITEGAPYPLYDVTTGPLNGMTKWQNEINRHRIGSVLSEPNYGGMAINWEADPVEIGVFIIDAKGVIKISTRIILSELKLAAAPSPPPESPAAAPPANPTETPPKP